MKNTFRWGIIGPGKISTKFAEDLQYVPDAKIVSVASQSIERAQNFSEKFGADNIYSNYELMLTSGTIDAVYIGTPHVFHKEQTLLALKHKVPVLCEKPLAMNLVQVQTMINAANENNTFLMEAMWTHFLPSILKVKEYIQSGVLGEILFIEADFGFQAPVVPEGRVFNPQLGASSILDVGVYPIFLSLLAGGVPQKVQAEARLSEQGIDLSCSMNFTYSNGSHALLHCSSEYESRREARICGTKGTLIIAPRWYASTHVTLLINNKISHVFEQTFPGYGYQFQAAEVANCIREGAKQSNLMSFEMSKNLMLIMDKVKSAAGVIAYDNYN